MTLASLQSHIGQRRSCAGISQPDCIMSRDQKYSSRASTKVKRTPGPATMDWDYVMRSPRSHMRTQWLDVTRLNVDLAGLRLMESSTTKIWRGGCPPPHQKKSAASQAAQRCCMSSQGAIGRRSAQTTEETTSDKGRVCYRGCPTAATRGCPPKRGARGAPRELASCSCKGERRRHGAGSMMQRPRELAAALRDYSQ